ncbi:MAG: hypothetical protein ACLUIO_27800 [Neglectibacter timonensis]
MSQCYQVMIEIGRGMTKPSAGIGCTGKSMDTAAADRSQSGSTYNPEELLCSCAVNILTLFSRVMCESEPRTRDMQAVSPFWRIDEPNVLPILKRMGMDLKNTGW